MINSKASFKVPSNWRSIALPIEHGAWSFLLEPILLGLLLGFSWRGLSFSSAMLALFLVHQPLKIAVKDYLRSSTHNRTIWARAFTGSYLSLALIFGWPTIISAPIQFYIPLALMIPLILIQGFYDFRNQSRELLPELAGAIALGASCSAILILAGWDLISALGLWLILMARTIPTILFVRAVLRKQRGKEANFVFVYIAHGLAFGFIASLALFSVLPYLSAFAILMLWGRAYFTLESKENIPPKILGFREIGFGLMTIILTCLGYSL